MKKAVPVIFFEKCSYEGRPKGNAIFHGFGILESVELVTQYGNNQEYFANYLFNFCIFLLQKIMKNLIGNGLEIVVIRKKILKIRCVTLLLRGNAG